MERIECRISCDEVPVHSGMVAYFDAVQRKLESAGVEFSDGEPVGGTLARMDDPQDFGASVWVFTPIDKARET